MAVLDDVRIMGDEIEARVVPLTACAVVETLARADGSTGWGRILLGQPTDEWPLSR